MKDLRSQLRRCPWLGAKSEVSMVCGRSEGACRLQCLVAKVRILLGDQILVRVSGVVHYNKRKKERERERERDREKERDRERERQREREQR